MTRMADACPGLTFDRLSWAADWRVRVDGLLGATTKFARMAKPAPYPALESLIGGTGNTKRIRQHWDNLPWLISSIGLGTVSVSPILGKLAASDYYLRSASNDYPLAVGTPPRKA